MKKLTMHYTGVKKVRITTIGPIRLSKDKFREKWLQKVARLGQLGK
jgi:putative NADPH-quinone reductase